MPLKFRRDGARDMLRAARALVAHSLSHGWGAADYIIAKTFAYAPALLPRVFFVDPPVSRQPHRERDTNIQNYLLVDGRELDANQVDMRRLLLQKLAAQLREHRSDTSNAPPHPPT